MKITSVFIIQIICVSFFFLFSLSYFLFATSAYPLPPHPLKINLISCLSGQGLEADQKILAEAITALGHSAIKLRTDERERHSADINIFLQVLVPEQYSWAHFNWFIPNPEWYTQDLALLDNIDLILCRTKEVKRIFQGLNKPTYDLGFISTDCYRQEIKKDYSHVFHLAGKSPLKGTTAIQHLWLSDPSLPLLTGIQFPTSLISNQKNLEWIPHRIPLKQLRRLQNRCGIHLCPSETEGFGHSLVESMSTGAVVITTDAPPMNEFIQDKRCLVPYFTSQPLYLGITYHVDWSKLKETIQSVGSLPLKELQSIGLKNRALYLQRKREFYEKLKELLWVVSLHRGLSL